MGYSGDQAEANCAGDERREFFKAIEFQFHVSFVPSFVRFAIPDFTFRVLGADAV